MKNKPKNMLILPSILLVLLFCLGLYLAISENTHINIVGSTLSIATIVMALFSKIFTLMRDELREQHELKLQDSSQMLSIGGMSHMSNVTFDKHVDFCEAYVKEFASVVHKIFKDGPTSKCLEYSSDLANIREKYVLWITKDIKEPLIELEGALRKIGAKQGLLKSIPKSKKRTKIVNQIYSLFDEIIELKNDKKTPKQEKEEQSKIAISKITEHLRQILQADDFVELRKA